MYHALLATGIVALLSLVGAFFFGRVGKISGTHRYILPIAIGVFLGVVFFELIPETLLMNERGGSIAIAAGFLLFYLLSHIIHTYHHHHHHDQDGCVGSGATMLLVGDSIHNIADGVIITSAFLINPALGIATTIGVALHEIPQEIAEFGVLLQSGYTKKKAALLNLLSASSIFLGVLLTMFFTTILEGGLWVLTGLAAGNLLYIAATDLLPELQDAHRGHFLRSFLLTLLGLVMIGTLFWLAP